MAQRPWYKRFPGDFLSGTAMLSAEHKGVYSVLLDMMYDRHAAIPDQPTELARICGCSTRRFNQIKADLVREGKITIADGMISNPRFERQNLSEEKEHEKLAENGAKGGDKTAENKATASNSNDLSEKGLVAVYIPEARYQKETKKEPADAGSSSNVVPFTPDVEPDPEDSYEDQFWAHEKKCSAAGVPKSMMGQLAQLHGGDFHTALLNLKDALRAKGPRPYLAKTIQNIRRERQVAEAPKPTADGTLAWCGDKLKPGYGDTWM